MRSIYDIDGLRVVTGPLHWMCLGPFGISHPYKIRRNAAMNRFIILAMVCLMTSMTFAAQCAGLTKKGERCKREAAEGSKYCIGHADQEKSATRLKDDGTCWAVTEAGTRCKHKKDGESDYCKQHNADTKAKRLVASAVPSNGMVPVALVRQMASTSTANSTASSLLRRSPLRRNLQTRSQPRRSQLQRRMRRRKSSISLTISPSPTL